jgi:hypothetical protein
MTALEQRAAAAAWDQVVEAVFKSHSYDPAPHLGPRIDQAIQRVGWKKIWREVSSQAVRAEFLEAFEASRGAVSDAATEPAETIAPAAAQTPAPDPRGWRAPESAQSSLDGIAARDDGIARALARQANHAWYVAFVRAIEGFPPGIEFCAEDIVRVVGEPPHIRLPGPCMVRVCKLGLVETTGKYRAATDPKKCAHANPVWRRAGTRAAACGLDASVPTGDREVAG